MHTDLEAVDLSRLLAKYDVYGPRYTSYPTALQFHEGFEERDYLNQVQASNDLLVPRPLSLYVHIPFCKQLCYYCGCHKVVTQKTSQSQDYLDALYREIALRSEAFAEDRLVQQIHLGGGTPTYISNAQIRELLEVIAQSFHLGLPDKLEMGIEVDPRTVDGKRMQELVKIGFNRISFGVQDFDPAVQQAINRAQSKEQVRELHWAARDARVSSISMDLIYGLPKQNRTSFERTLDEVAALRPDRIALYNYAHMPQRIPSQRLIHQSDLPGTEEKLAIFTDAVARLTAEGYIYIGMDHFALPDDSLATALKDGSLQRNFQGYSTHADCDIVGLGASSISRVGDCYVQNVLPLSAYRQALAADRLPVHKGVVLNRDDRLRADIILTIMCSGEVNFAEFSQRHDVFFQQVFRDELASLQTMQEDGLLRMDNARLQVTPLGRLFLRNIAMTFDAYLNQSLHDTEQPRYSKTL